MQPILGLHLLAQSMPLVMCKDHSNYQQHGSEGGKEISALNKQLQLKSTHLKSIGAIHSSIKLNMHPQTQSNPKDQSKETVIQST